jgi:GNAT superfamily N-acetyltransferase
MQPSAVTRTSSLAQAEATVGFLPVPRIMWLKDDRRVVMRTACATDGAAVQQFVRGLSVRSRRNRFFSPLRELSQVQLDSITCSPPSSGVALVGEAADAAGSRIMAMAQYVVCGPLEAEFAIVIDDAWQRQGLGNEMLGMLAEHAARAGLASFAGFVLPENWPMLALLSRFDCEFVSDADPGVIRVIKRFDAYERAHTRQSEASHRPDPGKPVLPGEAGWERVESVTA